MRLLRSLYDQISIIKCGFILFGLVMLLTPNYFLQAQNTVHKTRAKDSLIIAYYIKKSDDYSQAHPDSSLAYLYRALAYSKQKRLVVYQINLTSQIAELADQIGESENLKSFLLQQYNYFKGNKIENGYLEVSPYLAHQYQSLNQYDSAYYYCNVLINTIKRSNPKYNILMTMTLRKRAELYQNEGKFSQAIKDLQRTLPLVDSTNSFLRSSIQLVLGTVYTDFGDKIQALSIFKKLHKSSQQYEDKSIQAYASYYIADLLSSDSTETALKYAKESRMLFEKVNLAQGVLMNQVVLGKIYAYAKDFVNAEKYYSQALKLAPELQLPEIKANMEFELGNIALQKNNFKRALDYCLTSWKYEINSSVVVNKYDVCDCLSKAYKGLGQLSKAQAYAILASQFQDSAKNEAEIRESYKLQNKYELEQKDAIHALEQKQQKEINQQKLRAKNYTIIGLVVFMLLLGALGYMFYKNKQRKNEAFLLKEKEAAQHKFSQELIQFQEEEKTRISRELHDSVGQDLILLKTKAGLNKHEDLEHLAGKTLENVRSITQNLHPFVLQKFGLTTAIKKLLGDIDSSSHIFISEDIDEIDGLLDKQVELNVYRIIQEAMNNILKHAQTPSVELYIKKTDQHIDVQIKDHGKGFDLQHKAAILNSLGLKTMQERSRIINAQFSLSSVINEGTIIQLIIPIKNA